MRVKVYELEPGDGGFVLDKRRMYCEIAIKDGVGSFKFLDRSREKLIRELFDGPSMNFVSGGTMPDGTHWDAMETVVSRVFRTFDLPSYSGRLLGCGCFAPGPHGGQEQSGQAMATISASRSICR